MTLRSFLALALLATPAAAVPATARAQSAPVQDRSWDVSPDVEDALCWRGKPLPECGGFVIVEGQVGVPLLSTSVRESIAPRSDAATFEEPRLDWNLGYMWNVSPGWAVGGTFSVGTGSSDPVTGIRLRARRWLDAPFSAEVEAGAIRTDFDGARASDPTWGLTAGGRLNVLDLGSLFASWDAAPFDPDDPRLAGEVQHVLNVGVGAGSTLAVAGTAAGFGLLLLLLSMADFE